MGVSNVNFYNPSRVSHAQSALHSLRGFHVSLAGSLSVVHTPPLLKGGLEKFILKTLETLF